VSLVLGTVDLHGTRTSLAQVAAEELDLDVSEVRVVAHSDGTGGDKVTYGQSKAAREACQDLLARLKQRLADYLKVPPEDVEYGEKRFWARGTPETVMSLADLATRTTRGGGAVIGYASASGLRPAPMAAAHVVDVGVDRETGEVQIARRGYLGDGRAADVHHSRGVRGLRGEGERLHRAGETRRSCSSVLLVNRAWRSSFCSQ
jgi:CO/xanthine dehydrogenase Mo-binding subunit